MENFIYLIQGQADLVQSFFHLKDRDSSNAIFLTYDKKIDNALYFPNSTWAEGRNKLLEVALAKRDYQYYIFCDDDIDFKMGSWNEFEKCIIKYEPAIAVPVFLAKTFKTPLPGFKFQSILFNDEQLIAFHRDVARDGIILPYQTKFDKITWWAACEIQQILIQNFYYLNSIQFNNIHISNECRLRYPNLNPGIFQKQLREWLAKQFVGVYKDISKSVKRNIIKVIWRTISFSLRHYCNTKTLNYSIDKTTIKNTLLMKSHLLKQYLHNK
jgi:hypothetical protein